MMMSGMSRLLATKKSSFEIVSIMSCDDMMRMLRVLLSFAASAVFDDPFPFVYPYAQNDHRHNHHQCIHDSDGGACDHFRRGIHHLRTSCGDEPQHTDEKRGQKLHLKTDALLRQERPEQVAEQGKAYDHRGYHAVSDAVEGDTRKGVKCLRQKVVEGREEHQGRVPVEELYPDFLVVMVFLMKRRENKGETECGLYRDEDGNVRKYRAVLHECLKLYLGALSGIRRGDEQK